MTSNTSFEVKRLVEQTLYQTAFSKKTIEESAKESSEVDSVAQGAFDDSDWLLVNKEQPDILKVSELPLEKTTSRDRVFTEKRNSMYSVAIVDFQDPRNFRIQSSHVLIPYIAGVFGCCYPLCCISLNSSMFRPHFPLWNVFKNPERLKEATDKELLFASQGSEEELAGTLELQVAKHLRVDLSIPLKNLQISSLEGILVNSQGKEAVIFNTVKRDYSDISFFGLIDEQEPGGAKEYLQDKLIQRVMENLDLKVKENEAVLRDVDLVNAFLSASVTLNEDYKALGSTGSVVYSVNLAARIGHEVKVFNFNLGDCRTLAKRGESWVQMSVDAKAANEPFKSYVEQTGINEPLSTVAAFGSQKESVITTPRVSCLTLDFQDKFCVAIAPNGIWNRLTSKQFGDLYNQQTGCNEEDKLRNIISSVNSFSASNVSNRGNSTLLLVEYTGLVEV
jgi:serine/threonine protein phosphatase PrpC